MPIHDWTRVRANRFHDFHQSWTIRLKETLNAGLLPANYVAMAEPITGGPEPDVVTLSVPFPADHEGTSGVAVLDTPPKARVQVQAEVRNDATISPRYSRAAHVVSGLFPAYGVRGS